MTQIKCWLCLNEANSREHIIKKSDIVRAYGRQLQKNSLSHVRAGVQRLLQSPDSKIIKYEPSLCHTCNTTITQPFDRAYDTFINYIYKNENDILRKRFIDFYDVYGESFEEGQRNLYKYFTKSFACRLYSANHKVPEDVVALMCKEHFQTALRLNFSVSEDIIAMPKDVRDGFIGKGELFAMLNKKDTSIVNGYTWNEHVSWFFTSYWYNVEPNGALACIWVADSQYVYLGCHGILDEAQKNEMAIKLSGLN